MKKKLTTRNASTPVDSNFAPLNPWEYEGTTYTKGDVVRIKELDGTARFWYAQLEKTGRYTICVFWEGHCFRFFYADEVLGSELPPVAADGIRATKRRAVLKYAEERRGQVVTIVELCSHSALSAPTVTKIVKERSDLFTPHKRGQYRITESMAS